MFDAQYKALSNWVGLMQINASDIWAKLIAVWDNELLKFE